MSPVLAVSPPTTVVPPADSADAAWEKAHADEILNLKSQAEALVLAGDLNGGHEKYRELELLVSDHAVSDPRLAREIESALNAEERIYTILVNRSQNSPRVAMDRGPTTNRAQFVPQGPPQADAAFPNQPNQPNQPNLPNGPMPRNRSRR